ncbi:MAG: S1 RNA-binding domain-containing protein [Erysipelothrix sp.]|nr:S1 RNA-binding domain-containing protein [Erysipelothrix sp.]
MKRKLNTIEEVLITGIEPYGAFVIFDDGAKGLLHISEISHDYVNDINAFVKKNDRVKVKIIDLLDDGNIRVSLKATQTKSPRRQRRRHHSIDHKFKIGFDSLAKELPKWIKQMEDNYGSKI